MNELPPDNEFVKYLVLLFLWIVASSLLVVSILSGDILLFIASFCLYTAIGTVILDDEQKENAD